MSHCQRSGDIIDRRLDNDAAVIIEYIIVIIIITPAVINRVLNLETGLEDMIMPMI